MSATCSGPKKRRETASTTPTTTTTTHRCDFDTEVFDIVSRYRHPTCLGNGTFKTGMHITVSLPYEFDTRQEVRPW